MGLNFTLGAVVCFSGAFDVATKTHYDVLGLSPLAEPEVVRAAYKALAQKYHPDRRRGASDDSTARMANINVAYAVLGDAQKRAAYDLQLQRRAQTQAQRTSASPSSHASPGHAGAAHASQAGGTRKDARGDTHRYAELLAKLEGNRLDEMQIVHLFETLFGVNLKIHEGWVNSYSYRQGKTHEHLSFSALKHRLMAALAEAQ
ncbi:MAG: hypothetical protein FGM28_05920 [Limnohabitans sp.]|nr:hypothetical protein [Limnohabitans sp.]